MEIEECLEFFPNKIINKTRFSIENGAYIYTVNKLDDRNYAEAYYYSITDNVFIPVHLKDSGLVELDEYNEIYLPFKNNEISCGTLVYDTILDPEITYGLWGAVDENHNQVTDKTNASKK